MNEDELLWPTLESIRRTTQQLVAQTMLGAALGTRNPSDIFAQSDVSNPLLERLPALANQLKVFRARSRKNIESIIRYFGGHSIKDSLKGSIADSTAPSEKGRR